MIGGHGSGGEAPPRVVHISIAQFDPAIPEPGRALDYLVTFHVEGDGLSWQRNVTVSPEVERRILAATESLYQWSRGHRSGTAPVRELDPALHAHHLVNADSGVLVREVGQLLHDTFIGEEGVRFLEDGHEVSAYLFDVDETTLNIPWELTGGPDGPLAFRTPFGRLVTSRVRPLPRRDPIEEDRVVRILVVANPTLDLPAAEVELAEIQQLSGNRGKYRIEVTALTRGEATPRRFKQSVSEIDFDILHFAGHSALDRDAPEQSAIRLSGGALKASEVMSLRWKKAPPYLVFNSACESGRAVGGRRLVGAEDCTNGLAAGFLAAGVMAYAGYFWPVTDVGAALFASTFYRNLFDWENVGLAYQMARNDTDRKLSATGDLTAFSAVLFGDAATGERPNLAQAV